MEKQTTQAKIRAVSQQNLSLGLLTRSDTNQAVQPEIMVMGVSQYNPNSHESPQIDKF